MRYAKILNEQEIQELNPLYINIDGMIYTNPLHNPNFNAQAMGFKELVVDDVPQYDETTQCIERYYQEQNGKIHRSWRVRNLTEQEIAERERFNNIMKGE